MATRTWSSVGSNDMNNAANYSGAGALLTTDDLVFNNTSVINATATANLDVASITVAANYSGNWSIAEFSAVAETGNMSFDGTGTLNLGNGITLNGASATLHVGSGVGTVTATNCAVTMNGSIAMVIDIDKTSVFGQFVLGNNAVVTNTSAAIAYFQANASPLVMGDNSDLINNGLLRFRITGSGPFMTLGSGYAISGTSTIILVVYIASGAVTIPSITTQNVDVTIQEQSGISGWTVQFVGTVNLGTGSLTIRTATAITGNYDFNNQNITCGILSVGNLNAGATSTINYSSGTFNVTGYNGLNFGVCNENFQSSVWSVSGSWTFGSNHTITPGTSEVAFTNTAVVTSNSKLFYDFVINAAGKTITLADALSCHDFTNIAGTLAGAFTTTASGDVDLYVDTTFSRLIMTKATTRRISVAATKTIILTNLTATNLNGGAGALNEWRSFTPGTQFNLVIPAPIALLYQNPQDCVASQVIDVTDDTSVNGGNNTNWTFPATAKKSKNSFSMSDFSLSF